MRNVCQKFIAVAAKVLFGVASIFAIGLFALLMSSGSASASPRPHDSGLSVPTVTLADSANGGSLATNASDTLTATSDSDLTPTFTLDVNQANGDSSCSLANNTGGTATLTVEEAGVCYVYASTAADSTYDAGKSPVLAVVFSDSPADVSAAQAVTDEVAAATTPADYQQAFTDYSNLTYDQQALVVMTPDFYTNYGAALAVTHEFADANVTHDYTVALTDFNNLSYLQFVLVLGSPEYVTYRFSQAVTPDNFVQAIFAFNNLTPDQQNEVSL